MDLNVVRKRLEAREESLSPFAARVARSAGRARPEAPHPLRTEYQRDRDRIIHTNSFRRMKHKSQVFLAPLDDHYVTRLTHTIEVQQVARTIARALNLNEDLVEAIALGHDLGHTPFGHIGEKALDGLLPGGFHHSQHSVRMVERLEKGGRGLNLTREVVEGILRHSKPQGEFLDAGAVEGMTLEAQIVRISDAVAYLTHDIGDAIRAGVITLEDLPAQAVDALGERHSQRVNALVSDIVISSWACTGSESAPDLSPSNGAQGERIKARGRARLVADQRPMITMSSELGDITTELRNFMFEEVYLPLSESPEGRAAQEIVCLLFEHYRGHPEEIPKDLRDPGETVARMAADMVCGMTDRFALHQAERIQPGIAGHLFEGRL